MWLTPKLSYKLDLNAMTMCIKYSGGIKIIGYPLNMRKYLNRNIREAKLVVCENSVFLHVTVKKYVEDVTNVIARDRTRVKDCIRIKKHKSV